MKQCEQCKEIIRKVKTVVSETTTPSSWKIEELQELIQELEEKDNG